MITSKIALGSHCRPCFEAAGRALHYSTWYGNTDFCVGNVNDQCNFLFSIGPHPTDCIGVNLVDCSTATVGKCLGCALKDLRAISPSIDEKRLNEIWKAYKEAKCCDVIKDKDLAPKPNDHLCKEPCKQIECAIKTYKKKDYEDHDETVIYVFDLSNSVTAAIIFVFLLFIIVCYCVNNHQYFIQKQNKIVNHNDF